MPAHKKATPAVVERMSTLWESTPGITLTEIAKRTKLSVQTVSEAMKTAGIIPDVNRKRGRRPKQ